MAGLSTIATRDMEGGREGGKEGEREGGKEGEREGRREGGRVLSSLRILHHLAQLIIAVLFLPHSAGCVPHHQRPLPLHRRGVPRTGRAPGRNQSHRRGLQESRRIHPVPGQHLLPTPHAYDQERGS